MRIFVYSKSESFEIWLCVYRLTSFKAFVEKAFVYSSEEQKVFMNIHSADIMRNSFIFPTDSIRKDSNFHFPLLRRTFIIISRSSHILHISICHLIANKKVRRLELIEIYEEASTTSVLNVPPRAAPSSVLIEKSTQDISEFVDL